jgi:hypothetical protein
LTLRAFLVILLVLLAPLNYAQTIEKPRLIVLTDIGGDPDDQQSMIRLMTYANEFDIEGLIASASGTPGELGIDIVKPHLIREIVQGYGRVRDNLLLHRKDYPSTQYLLNRIKSGNPKRGVTQLGPGKDTEGSSWIISVVDSSDPRPVNIAIWGGSTDLAQALWRVWQSRSPAGLRRFINKIRVHAIGHQDDTGPWILEHFPDLFYVLSMAPEGADKRNAVYRGMYLGGDQSLTSLDWVNHHVKLDHGPLGALYPLKTWTAPNPHGVLKEGDTPSWFYFLRNGLSDPQHPEWGCWGGRFHHANGGLYRDASDQAGSVKDVRATVWRWRPAYQNDFQARMDWCVKPFSRANHNPIAVVSGDGTRDILDREVSPKTTVPLSAAGSTDPDGDSLSFHWFVYKEAGTYSGEVKLARARTTKTAVEIPVDAAGSEIHVVLELRDEGEPPLFSYRRVVLHVTNKQQVVR